MSEPLAICFCGDAYLADHMPRLLSSLVAHHDPGDIVVHLATDITDREFCDNMKVWCERLELRLHVHNLAPSLAGIRERMNRGSGPSNHLNHMSYGRWFLPEILHDVDRAVYLDMDLIVTGSLAGIFDFLEPDAAVAAAPDFTMQNASDKQRAKWIDHHVSQLGHGVEVAGYVNSGVLALSMAKWREQNITSMLLETHEALLDEGRDLLLQDQDVLNVALNGRLSFLPTTFNVHVTPNKYDDRSMDWLAWEEVRVMHFCGAVKPWHENRWCILPAAVVEHWCRLLARSHAALDDLGLKERGEELGKLHQQLVNAGADLPFERRGLLLEGLWDHMQTKPDASAERAEIAAQPRSATARGLIVDTLVERMKRRCLNAGGVASAKARKKALRLTKRVGGLDAWRARWRFTRTVGR